MELQSFVLNMMRELYGEEYKIEVCNSDEEEEEEEEDKTKLHELYKEKYNCDIKDFDNEEEKKQADVSLDLPNIEQLTKCQLLDLQTKIQDYLHLIDNKIKNDPEVTQEQRIKDIEYLSDIFDFNFEDTDRLKSWFIKHAIADDFKLQTGYYFGKHSTDVNVPTTPWLKNNSLYYCRMGGGDWWQFDKKWDDPKHHTVKSS